MPRYTFLTEAQAGVGRDLARAAIFLLGEYVADEDILFDLDLALTEASTNVVRHAYQAPGGKLEISLEVFPGSHVVLEVADTGLGKRTSSYDYRCTGRGGQGLVAHDLSRRGGRLAASEGVLALMLVMTETSRRAVTGRCRPRNRGTS